MSILISSRASLMGTSDTSTLSSVFDALMEKKLDNDPVALRRYYQPVVQGPARGSAAPAAETTTAGPGAAGATPTAAGAVGTPGANVTGIAMMGQAPGMVAGMETLSPDKCPEGLTWRNDGCEATFKATWRFGGKVPQGTKTFPVEPKLVEKLNFDPGYAFVRIGADILALERDTGKVADAALNLGKAS